MRSRVTRIRHGGRDARIAPRSRKTLVRERRSIVSKDDVVCNARMLGVLLKQLLEVGGGDRRNSVALAQYRGADLELGLHLCVAGRRECYLALVVVGLNGTRGQ